MKFFICFLIFSFLSFFLVGATEIVCLFNDTGIEPSGIKLWFNETATNKTELKGLLGILESSPGYENCTVIENKVGELESCNFIVNNLNSKIRNRNNIIETQEKTIRNQKIFIWIFIVVLVCIAIREIWLWRKEKNNVQNKFNGGKK